MERYMVLVYVGFIIRFVRVVLTQYMNWVVEQCRYYGQSLLLFHMIHCTFVAYQGHLCHISEGCGVCA